MTNKDSHEMMIMIQKYETNLRKNISKGNYALEFSDDNIDDKKFHQNKRGAYVSEVIVIFKDDFADYENQMNEKIKSMEEELEEKNQTIKKLEDRLSAIDEDHQKEIGNLKQEHSAKVNQLNEDLHDKDLEIEKVKTKYEREIGDLKEKYERELGDFREEIQKEINELEIFDEDYHMKISDHEKALNEMRGNCLKLRVRENKEYSSYIDDLDNLGVLSKLRNKDKEIIKQMRAYNNQTIDEKAIDVNFNLIDKK